jgi:hypothetical protein
MLISPVHVKLSIKLSTSDILSNYFLKRNYSEKLVILSTSENYRPVIFCQDYFQKKEKLIILSTSDILSTIS